MRIQQLEYFLKVAQTQSITQASEELFISQQALSRALVALENELNAQLLIRSYQGTFLTKDGKFFLQKAIKILKINKDILDYFQHSNQIKKEDEEQKLANKEHLKIFSVPMIKEYYLSSTISYIWKHDKSLKLSIKAAQPDEILKAVRERKCDLGFISTFEIDKQIYLKVEDENLKFTIFDRIRFVAMVSNNSPLAKYKSISIKHLMKYPIFLNPLSPLAMNVPYQLLSYFGDFKLIEVDSNNLLVQSILNDVGCSLAVEKTELLETHEEGIKYIPIRENVFALLGYIQNTDAAASIDAVSKFLQYFSASTIL